MRALYVICGSCKYFFFSFSKWNDYFRGFKRSKYLLFVKNWNICIEPAQAFLLHTLFLQFYQFQYISSTVNTYSRNVYIRIFIETHLEMAMIQKLPTLPIYSPSEPQKSVDTKKKTKKKPSARQFSYYIYIFRIHVHLCKWLLRHWYVEKAREGENGDKMLICAWKSFSFPFSWCVFRCVCICVCKCRQIQKWEDSHSNCILTEHRFTITLSKRFVCVNIRGPTIWHIQSDLIGGASNRETNVKLRKQSSCQNWWFLSPSPVVSLHQFHSFFLSLEFACNATVLLPY